MVGKFWIIAVLLGLALVGGHPAAAKVEKYTDDQGTLHITNVGPGDLASPGQAGKPSAPALKRSRSFPEAAPQSEPEPPEDNEPPLEEDKEEPLTDPEPPPPGPVSRCIEGVHHLWALASSGEPGYFMPGLKDADVLQVHQVFT
jgi:hypothetical protein